MSPDDLPPLTTEQRVELQRELNAARGISGERDPIEAATAATLSMKEMAVALTGAADRMGALLAGGLDDDEREEHTRAAEDLILRVVECTATLADALGVWDSRFGGAA